MNNLKTTKKSILEGKWFVTMTDNFMSGWGTAKNLTNKLVLVCDSYQEALKVENYAYTRNEMKYINVCSKKPSYLSVKGYKNFLEDENNKHYECRGYLVSIADKNAYGNWYK